MDRNRRFSRRRVLTSLGAAGVLGIAGCSSQSQSGDGESGDGGSGDGSGSGGSDEQLPGSDTWIGIVYPIPGLGDKAFADSAHRGLLRAVDDMGVRFEQAEPTSSDEFPVFFQRFASSTNPDFDLVIGMTFSHRAALESKSKQFPDQRFAIIDTVLDRPNVGSYVFREHECCYLAGYLSAAISDQGMSAGAGETNDNKIIGYVGGERTPVNVRFEAGYKEGMLAYDDSFELLVTYAGTYNEPSKGRSIANSMFDNGADIVFPAAGGTSIGVPKAAQESERYALGVDTDMSVTAPEFSDVIIASVVKKTGPATYSAIEDVVKGNYSPDVGSLGLKEDGLELVYGQDLGSAVPEDLKSTISSRREQIVNEDLEVPDKPEEV